MTKNGKFCWINRNYFPINDYKSSQEIPLKKTEMTSLLIPSIPITCACIPAHYGYSLPCKRERRASKLLFDTLTVAWPYKQVSLTIDFSPK